MTADQRSEVDMFYRLDEILDTFKHVYEGNKVFKACCTEFDFTLSDIEDAIDVQNKPTKTTTQQRDAKRKVLIDRLSYCCNRLMSYSAVIKDEDLRKQFYKTATDFRSMKDHELESITRLTIAEVKEHEAVLRDYSLTPEYMVTVQTALTEYSESVPQARMARISSRMATENLSSLIKKMLELLTLRMDLDIEVFKVSNPDFYAQYWAARVIDKPGTRVTMLNMFVSDTVTEEPVRAALCIFELSTDKTKRIEKRTAEKGSLRIGSLPEGIYSVRVEKMGYQTKQQNITVVRGERTVVEVELEKM